MCKSSNALRVRSVSGFTREVKFKIFSDFDGTISQQDSLKLLLEEYGRPDWIDLEAKIMSGEMSEREALPKMFEGFPLNRKEALDFVLKNVSLDPHFKNFAQWALEEGHELQILSGGFKSLILKLLEREGLQNLKVVANDFEVQPEGWKIKPAASVQLCHLCTHCKSSALLSSVHEVESVVYIGDGHTDFCPIQLATVIYAKKSLAQFCRKAQMPHRSFENFEDIQASLAKLQSAGVQEIQRSVAMQLNQLKTN